MKPQHESFPALYSVSDYSQVHGRHGAWRQLPCTSLLTNGVLEKLWLQLLHVCMQERVSLRDCQVGPGFTVSEGAEHREEVLAKAQQQRKSSDTKP